MTYFAGNCYPAVYYSSSFQIESDAPLANTWPVWEASVLESYSASGRRRRDLLLLEEKRQLSFYGLSPVEMDRWRHYYQNWGGLGRTSDLLVDRLTGRVFTFTNTTADSNTDPVSHSWTASYQRTGDKWGVIAPLSSAAYWPGLMGAANLGSRNAAFINSEGTIVLSVVCSFAGNDGVARYLFYWGESGAAGGMYLLKQAANTLMFGIFDNTSATYAVVLSGVNWPSGTRLWAACQWTTSTTMGLWLYVENSGTTQLTANTSGMTFTAPGSRFGIGAIPAGSSPLGNGVVFHFATYKEAYPDPTALFSSFPLGRNFYSSAELIDATFAPDRTAPGLDLWQAQLTFRQGVP